MFHQVPQTSAQRKFARGVEQVRQLVAEVESFEQREAYVSRTEVQSRTTHNVTFRVIATQREAPSHEWALLAGDAIHNLRSSLDHLVWACADEGERSRDTAFPICTSAREFQNSAKRKLRGVPELVRTVIEKWQPFRMMPEAPDHALLEQLRVISNRDKHQTLAVVATGVEREAIFVPEGITIEWVKPATGRVLGSGETHVSTLVARSESAIDGIDARVAYRVRIEGRSPGLLIGIVNEVHRVLHECETGLPLSPFAAPPFTGPPI